MVGVKIPRVGVKITRGSLTPGGQAAHGGQDKLFHRVCVGPGRKSRRQVFSRWLIFELTSDTHLFSFDDSPLI